MYLEVYFDIERKFSSEVRQLNDVARGAVPRCSRRNEIRAISGGKRLETPISTSERETTLRALYSSIVKLP